MPLVAAHPQPPVDHHQALMLSNASAAHLNVNGRWPAPSSSTTHKLLLLVPLPLADDTTPPALVVPTDVVVKASSPEVQVNFTATATDECTERPAVRCWPASGDFFPLGDTRVTCTARDTAGNSVNATFVVSVGECMRLCVVRACAL